MPKLIQDLLDEEVNNFDVPPITEAEMEAIHQKVVLARLAAEQFKQRRKELIKRLKNAIRAKKLKNGNFKKTLLDENFNHKNPRLKRQQLAEMVIADDEEAIEFFQLYNGYVKEVVRAPYDAGTNYWKVIYDYHKHSVLRLAPSEPVIFMRNLISGRMKFTVLNPNFIPFFLEPKDLFPMELFTYSTAKK